MPKFKIVCIATVEAKDELSAKQKILVSSNYENHFGVTIEPVDFTNLKVKNGIENRTIKESVSKPRT